MGSSSPPIRDKMAKLNSRPKALELLGRIWGPSPALTLEPKPHLWMSQELLIMAPNKVPFFHIGSSKQIPSPFRGSHRTPSIWGVHGGHISNR